MDRNGLDWTGLAVGLRWQSDWTDQDSSTTLALILYWTVGLYWQLDLTRQSYYTRPLHYTILAVGLY